MLKLLLTHMQRPVYLQADVLLRSCGGSCNHVIAGCLLEAGKGAAAMMASRTNCICTKQALTRGSFGTVNCSFYGLLHHAPCLLRLLLGQACRCPAALTFFVRFAASPGQSIQCGAVEMSKPHVLQEWEQSTASHQAACMQTLSFCRTVMRWQ